MGGEPAFTIDELFFRETGKSNVKAIKRYVTGNPRNVRLSNMGLEWHCLVSSSFEEASEVIRRGGTFERTPLGVVSSWNTVHALSRGEKGRR